MYGAPPIFSPNLRAYLSMRTFIMYKRNIQDNFCSMWRIVRTIGYGSNFAHTHVVINPFLPFYSSPIVKYTIQKKHVGPNTNIAEVVQSKQTVILEASLVDNICFVFHPEEVKKRNPTARNKELLPLLLYRRQDSH